MVELVRHTLVDGAVHLDIDVVSNLVGLEVGGERDVTLLPEGPREEIAGSGPETVSSRHFLSASSSSSSSRVSLTGDSGKTKALDRVRMAFVVYYIVKGVG
ncbi:hypothetical protein PanWU01x14_035980 [Parasponia andersonii]|uniref:Uncharacterized protein n=1 Tax=Parasponia andersonii TaxID=3476 RepID=A0A2P5DSB7_PARAD|nr:hypothetical protein PanWU01x14_035980 [Parasponia andersonii]